MDLNTPYLGEQRFSTYNDLIRGLSQTLRVPVKADADMNTEKALKLYANFDLPKLLFIISNTHGVWPNPKTSMDSTLAFMALLIKERVDANACRVSEQRAHCFKGDRITQTLTSQHFGLKGGNFRGICKIDCPEHGKS